jgi:hypothetical protein
MNQYPKNPSPEMQSHQPGIQSKMNPMPEV